jgi:OOP family OmpA-OmpF porin
LQEEIDMKNARLLLTGVLAASALAFTPLSHAQNWYAGAGFGQSKATDACTGASTLGVACDDTDTALRIFGGYQFNPNLAVEVGYSDLGKATASVPGLSGEWKSTAWDFMAVGMLPINPQLSVLGKIGLSSWSLDSTITASGIGSTTYSPTGSDVTYALGVQYAFTPTIGMRAEWQKFANIGDDVTGQSDVDVISASILFKF